MKRLLFFMFLSALLISACNNQNGTINGVDNDPTANIKNEIGKGNTNDNFPATPEPIPPGKGEIVKRNISSSKLLQ